MERANNMEERNKTDFNKEIKQSKELPRFRYQMGLPEQKMLLCFFGQLRQSDDKFVPAAIPIGDIITYCGFEAANGYRLVKQCARALSKDVLEYYNGKDFDYVPWFSFIKYRNGIVHYQLNQAIKTELLQLHEQGKLYVKVDPLLLPNFKTNYGLRIYLILKGELTSHKTEALFSMDELVYMLSLSQAYDPKHNTNAAANQKIKVIVPSIEEINKYTEIDVSFEPEKEGRKVIGWRFFIKPKESFILQPKQLPPATQPEETAWYKDNDVIKTVKKLTDNGLDSAALTKLYTYQNSKEDFLEAAEAGLVSLGTKKQHETVDNPGGFLYEAIKGYNPERLFQESRNEEEHKKQLLSERIATATKWQDILIIASEQTSPEYYEYVLRNGANQKPELLSRYQSWYDDEAQKAGSNEKYDIDIEVARYRVLSY